MRTTIGPAAGLCATCGCSVAHQRVTVAEEYDQVLGRTLPTYRHITLERCQAAQQAALAFWAGGSGAQRPQEVSSADA